MAETVAKELGADATVEQIATTVDYENAIKSLMVQYGFTREQAEEYYSETQEGTKAIDDQTDAVDGLRSSFRKLLGTLFDGINANNDYQESGWALAEAQEKVNKLVEEGKEGTEEHGKAVNELDKDLQDHILAAHGVYTSTFTTREEQKKAKEEALKYGEQLVKTGEWGEESFAELEEAFDESAAGIKTEIYDTVLPSYLQMYDKGVELDEQEIEPEIKADNKPAMDAIQKVIDKKIPDKHFTIYTHHREGFAGGGIAGFAGGGITGSDGFSLPILTAAQGLITLPRADEGLLALLHPPELVLNPDQALRVLWRIANEPIHDVKSGGDIINNYNITTPKPLSESEIRRQLDLLSRQLGARLGLG
ncbi:hypothetical protein ES708_24952 [subsurface metagenome]